MADEKEVIVTNDGSGGAGMIIAIVLLIAVLVGLFLLYQTAFSRGASDSTSRSDDERMGRVQACRKQEPARGRTNAARP